MYGNELLENGLAEWMETDCFDRRFLSQLSFDIAHLDWLVPLSPMLLLDICYGFEGRRHALCLIWFQRSFC